jgi:hypothetical protein
LVERDQTNLTTKGLQQDAIGADDEVVNGLPILQNEVLRAVVPAQSSMDKVNDRCGIGVGANAGNERLDHHVIEARPERSVDARVEFLQLLLKKETQVF